MWRRFIKWSGGWTPDGGKVIWGKWLTGEERSEEQEGCHSWEVDIRSNVSVIGCGFDSWEGNSESAPGLNKYRVSWLKVKTNTGDHAVAKMQKMNINQKYSGLCMRRVAEAWQQSTASVTRCSGHRKWLGLNIQTKSDCCPTASNTKRLTKSESKSPQKPKIHITALQNFPESSWHMTNKTWRAKPTRDPNQCGLTPSPEWWFHRHNQAQSTLFPLNLKLEWEVCLLPLRQTSDNYMMGFSIPEPNANKLATQCKGAQTTAT